MAITIQERKLYALPTNPSESSKMVNYLQPSNDDD